MTLCHLHQRAVLGLSGPDWRAFLQGLVTADVDTLAPGRPLYAGLLSPQGKALFQLFLFQDGEACLVDVAAGQIDALARRLAMYRLRREVIIAPEPALMVWQAWGSGSDGPPDPRLAAAGARFVAPAGRHAADTCLDRWHAHRLPLGLPEADEIGEDLLWLETNARELNGVSFTKGCYTGQENTARMHYRDRLRKRLLPLRNPEAGSGPPMAGDRIAGEWRGQPHEGMRMALLKTEYLDQPLTSDGRPLELIRPAWLPEPA